MTPLRFHGPLNNDCPECRGYGYDAFQCDRKPEFEIQRSDACDCTAKRSGKDPAAGIGTHDPGTYACDDDAALLFVRDLQHDVPYAQRCAVVLMTGDFARADHIRIQLCED